jgi:hypothetical protein
MIVTLGTLLGMFGGLLTASPALGAGRGPQWVALGPAEPITVPAQYCGFAIEETFPVDNEFGKALEDGMTFLLTGRLTMVSTNLSTGKSVSSNISGPGTFTFFPDGSVTIVSRGVSGLLLFPADAPRFGMPPVAVVAGTQTSTFDADGNLTSYSLQGNVVTDICAALS